MKRRDFLSGLGASLCLIPTIAVADLLDRAITKRALLIGVNQSGILGATTDVALQRELLCNRFGFDQSGVLTLTDRRGTRATIEEAITGHLIEPTMPGDLVVLHFSGLGTIVGDEPALLTSDGQIIPRSTLDLWLMLINTDRLICVIDAGYSYPGAGVVGNFRVRSRPWSGPNRLSLAEVSYQEELKTRLPPKPKAGIVLQAADSNQLCAEAPWDGLSFGLFTYILTQQLWQVSAPEFLPLALGNVGDLLNQLNLESPPLPSLPLGQDLIAPGVGDGVIVAGEGKTGELWLGGIPLWPLAYYGAGSVLKTPTQLLQVKSRNGLSAKVEVIGGEFPLQPGTLVQEEVRAIPKNVNLIVAIDVGLSRIERVDATSAISAIPRTSGVNGGEQYADCIFGKDEGRYGLFTLGGVPIVDSFGSADESVSVALRRLRPRLESLLALKLLHLSLNPHSSYLGFEAAVNVQTNNRSDPFTLFQTRARKSPQYVLPDHNLTIGDQLFCQIQNLTDSPLHIRIFCVDARYRLMSPSFVVPPFASDSVVPAQQQLIIPRPSSPVNWSVSPPQGNFEVLIIVSRSPLKNLADLTAGQAINGMLMFTNPLPIVSALLQDLTQKESEDYWLLPMQQWATIGFSYRVV